MNEDFGVRRRTEYVAVAPEPARSTVQEAALSTNNWNTNTNRLPSLNDYYNQSADGDTGGGSDTPEPASSPNPETKHWYARWWSNIAAAVTAHPRRSVAIGLAAALLIAGGTAYGLAMSHRKPAVKPAVNTVSKPKPAAPVIITSPLTGNVVSAADTKRVVTGVMIENTVFARPQSGLKDAGVVFEAIAEAGITRFLALFQEAQPANIGPVRSARPYYVDWAHTFDAPLAHVGGSPDALAKIKSDGVKDLDQFFNASAYHRISSREAPHNVYTSISALSGLENSKGWTSSSFTGFLRKKDAPTATPAAKSVNIAISGPTYNTHYDYDAPSNTYLRSEGGAPHKDADSGAQLAPKVVIGLVAPYSLMSDGYHSQYQITGSGEMTVFQDGTVTKGTWTKKDATSPYDFVDAEGHPLKLNAGQTWITVVGASSAISYTP